jgi:ankyrin repeat protein
MNTIDQELLDVAGQNNLSEVERLLSVGADVNAMENNGNTPLLAAVANGNVHVVQVLMEHGADIDVKFNGWTTVHLAVLQGHLAVVIELRKHGADMEEKETADGFTPLHFAVIKGHLAVVNELLIPSDSNGATIILGERKSRGVCIDPKNINGNTPLCIACVQGHLAIVKALLAIGADCRVTNNKGFLPIYYAVQTHNSAVAKCLLQHFYATTRHLPLHEFLKDLTWIVNPDISDVPPLRDALDRGVLGDAVEILEYLVDQNPELLRSRDQDGSLPLHVACRRGASFAIVQSLVSLYKASVKSVTPEGDLPLFLACELPATSLDTIFLLMKLYPDLVYRLSL